MKEKDFKKLPITCSIGETVEIGGDFVSKESTRIDGKINGNVTVESMLSIGSTAVISGDITAVSLIMAGKVTGNITVKENIEILSTANIKGDLVCSSMIMDENAYFEGNCKMNRSDETTETK